MKNIVVIGGGPGGVAAAIRAAQLGASVKMIEAGDVGGVCMNRGCIPLSVLGSAALACPDAARLTDLNLSGSGPVPDQATLLGRLRQTSGYIRMGTMGLLRSNGVEVISGCARLAVPGGVMVDDRSIEADAVILAGGAQWRSLDIPGADLPGVTTTDELFSLTELPPSVLVVGGPPWAVELAQMLTLLGVETTLAVTDSLIPEMDRQVGNRLKAALEKAGLKIVTKARLTAVEQREEDLCGLFDTKKGELDITARNVIRTQRLPRLQGLGLAGAGLNSDGSGLEVNEYLETGLKGVYAIGDLVSGRLSSHRASTMGLVAAANAMGERQVFDETAIPTAVFTRPGAASVGLTEKQARREGYEVLTGEVPYGVNARAIVEIASEGFAKVICDETDHRLLGVHLMGPHSAEIIGQACLALNLKARAEDLADVAAPHPAYSECLVEAARSALGRAVYLPVQSGG